MNRKFVRSVRALYEAMLVLVVIASAALLIGALYYALNMGSRGKVNFDAAFNEVGGIKEGSSVLFKGMPVGAVGKMRYDATTDKILVRIEIPNRWTCPPTSNRTWRSRSWASRTSPCGLSSRPARRNCSPT